MGTGDILVLGFESVSGDRNLFISTFIVLWLSGHFGSGSI